MRLVNGMKDDAISKAIAEIRSRGNTAEIKETKTELIVIEVKRTIRYRALL